MGVKASGDCRVELSYRQIKRDTLRRGLGKICGNSRRIFDSCSQHVQKYPDVESVIGIQLDKSVDDVQQLSVFLGREMSKPGIGRLQPDRAHRLDDGSSHMHTAHCVTHHSAHHTSTTLHIDSLEVHS